MLHHEYFNFRNYKFRMVRNNCAIFIPFPILGGCNKPLSFSRPEQLHIQWWMATTRHRGCPQWSILCLLWRTLPRCHILHHNAQAYAVLFIQHHIPLFMAYGAQFVGILVASRFGGEDHFGDYCIAGIFCVYVAHSGEYASHFRVCATYR